MIRDWKERPRWRRAAAIGALGALLSIAAFLLGAVGCDNLPFDEDTGKEARAEDRQIEVNGVELHYREWGRTDARPVLLLHGLTGRAWEFDTVAEALSDEYRVLVVNQRGHGASARTYEYSPQVMADDIAALVGALKLDPVAVIGHSMGGVNGWWLASSHPEHVERLVIIDVAPSLITSPAVIRAGDSPFPIEALREMEQRMNQAELVEIAGSGHDIHIDQPDALVGELRSFLR